ERRLVARSHGAKRLTLRDQPRVGTPGRNRRGWRWGWREGCKRRIVAADLSRLRKRSQICRGRLLNFREARHVAQIGGHPARQPFGQHCLGNGNRSEEHTSELQSREKLV